MKISDIINEIDILSAYIPAPMRRRTILTLCHNSRYATPTCAFFCKTGAISDGHAYAYSAYLNGARIFIAEKALDLPADAAVIITPSSAAALNKLAVQFYGDPSKELKIIGITGTKGKTTVAISAYKVASNCGISAGYIGTNGVYYNGKSFETANTTPDALELQKTLREMRDDGVTTVFLEVSSQALWQDRIHGLEFDSCVFTNLYRDHIGGYEHPDIEHYKASKKKLFTDYKTKCIIVNSDSQDSEYMMEGSECTRIITTSASGNEKCDLYSTNARKSKNGILPGVSFALHVGKKVPFEAFIPVPGLYSVENALLVIAICTRLGLTPLMSTKHLANLSVPGRFETVCLDSKPDSLFIIDYAHNGASLKAVINALREYEPKRLICLFGSVGGRTFERRTELGEVARDNADIIIITSDNPNNEDPMNVISDIRRAVGNTEKEVYCIPDRAEAVRKAYEIAAPGDYVLLAGKGHETYQLICGKRVPFSEREILIHEDLLVTKI